MSKRYTSPPVDFTDYLDTKERENTTPVTLGDKTFLLYSREHLSEDKFKELQNATEAEVICRIMLDDYDGFIAAGGSTPGLLSLIEDIAEKRAAGQGLSVGESGASVSS
jgi:hypothetical protein